MEEAPSDYDNVQRRGASLSTGETGKLASREGRLVQATTRHGNDVLCVGVELNSSEVGRMDRSNSSSVQPGGRGPVASAAGLTDVALAGRPADSTELVAPGTSPSGCGCPRRLGHQADEPTVGRQSESQNGRSARLCFGRPAARRLAKMVGSRETTASGGGSSFSGSGKPMTKGLLLMPSSLGSSMIPAPGEESDAMSGYVGDAASSVYGTEDDDSDLADDFELDQIHPSTDLLDPPNSTKESSDGGKSTPSKLLSFTSFYLQHFARRIFKSSFLLDLYSAKLLARLNVIYF
ncbi:unnamed protein product [Protopolystoma xenopodis]|uniref:Uncharacterized protein n=1 Tax=Protopolystoma xenopodis TaxID=117903 RepID=A0A448XQW7_9PLAT|nr:unnamed protein product [Protopolystoma xenopodis]